MNEKRLKAENYGKLLAELKGRKLISYNEFGSYQGDWIACLENGDSIELWKGGYGSCSGCDWIQAVYSWDDETVSLEQAEEYFKDDRPFIEISTDLVKKLSLKEFESLLPKNTRSDIWNFDPKELLRSIKEGLNSEPSNSTTEKGK